MLGKITTKEIYETLVAWKSPLSIKTIQRCVREDKRIIKIKNTKNKRQNTI